MTTRPRTSLTTSSTRSWRPDPRRRWSHRAESEVLALVAALALLVSCSSAGVRSGPQTYDATLWVQRPVVDLALDVAPDLRSVTGHESVVFTPELPTCEMVFRAWPNSPSSSRAGASLTVTRGSVDGRPTEPEVQAAGAPAGAPGTLVRLALPQCRQPGQAVRADLAFTLTLGRSPDERVGSDPVTHTAWSGTGFPMLAWVRGSGWARDPAVDAYGETEVSEDFNLSALEITAPSQETVVGTGQAIGTAPGARPGTTVHRFAAPAVRDVAFAVGAYDLHQKETDGVNLHVATPKAGTRTSPAEWLDQTARALTALSPINGPYPYSDLWLTITPARGADGTEFPTALQLTDADPADVPALVTHEAGHQWFYSLVGNDQGRDPWLDEALATLGEQVTGVSDYSGSLDSDHTGETGRPLDWFADHGGTRAYNRAVYQQGAASLAEARERVGAAVFDADLRRYVRQNAHRLATRADFRSAFADQPEVLDLLVRAGALPDGS